MDSANALTLLDDMIKKARKAGADGADGMMAHSVSLSYAQRLGTLERLEREEGQDLGLRVFVGRRQAIVSSTDTDPAAMDTLVERALAMARAVPEDPHCGLAEPAQLAEDLPSLDMEDPDEPTTEHLIARAAACEEAARAVEGVTNSEGAEASWTRGAVALATSNGFAASYASSRHAVAVSVLAGEGLSMERDYDFSSCVHGADLEDPAEIGRRAGERAVKRLGARRVSTKRVPVVFDPRVAGGLVGHLASAINGAAIARGTSFLKDKMGEQIFAPGITIVDDPHRPRGLRSKPFDGEGVANDRLEVIADGRLTTWILDLASARQLGLETTGRAARSASAPPSPSTTNLYMAPGEQSPDALMADIDEGLYVTEMMGMGINGITGDYSRGAAGFWIERGELAYPVSELTIASNLKEMFPRLTPADDLTFRYGTNAPTLRIEGMTVAGQ